jgi:asparagine synthase (glutamine-hydrolysing)
MAHSVEGRVPFLDHELFEYARHLPLEMKINNSTEKFVLREAVRGLVTDEIYGRQKHPFVAPPVSTFADSHSQMILQDELRSSDFAAVPFFDHGKILKLLDTLPDMPAETRAANDPVFMTALSAVALQKRFALKG